MTSTRAWILLALLLQPASAAAQGPPSRSQILSAGWNVMQKAGFCSFVPAGQDVILIRLTPSRMEVVSEARGLTPDPKTWLPVAVTFP